MFYIYIIQSDKDKGLYIGRTNNLERRLSEHNNGRVSSTKSRRPFKILEITKTDSEKDSVVIEKEHKKGYKREKIKKKYNIGGFA
ncbi:MAG: GIY-YIG nuclease family protein [bacterium]